MYIMCLNIFEEKAEIQDQYPLILNPVQKADDPIQDRNRSIGPLCSISPACASRLPRHASSHYIYLKTMIRATSHYQAKEILIGRTYQ